AIGMALLVIAHAFSHGISDVMFNRILNYVTGHVSVAFSVKGNYNSQIFRDGEAMLARARRAAPGAGRMEEALGIFTRVVGTGQSDNVVLVSVNTRVETSAKEMAEIKANFGMIEGEFEDVLREDLENPVILADEKAKYLNVKHGDVIRARFQDVHGRNQAVRLTVAGIFKPANVFMTAPVFMDLERLKIIAGYGPQDIAGFRITLEDPKRNAIPVAESLHAALKPPLAAAHGRLILGARSRPATVLGFQVDTASLDSLAQVLGLKGTALDRKSVLAGRALADSLGLRPGDACTLSYAAKHGGGQARAVFKVTGVFPPVNGIPENLLLVNDRDFYGFYYEAWPAAPRPEDGAFLPDTTHPLRRLLAPEWVLMERTATTKAMQAKYREATRLKTRATLVDVQTMYESASMIVNVETALNLITLVAVLILFFIIQVGVVNTLRMTIRERTREIGTMRAIGMHRKDVRAQFLLETLFLSAAASVVGLLLAFLGMWALRQIPFQTEGNPMGMILVDGHLHFLPTLLGTGAYVLLILAIALITAWFPARRAANLSPTEALRHFG
ncbi:MAG TPA: FtsX-like permease family protein, partial [Fibrobacteria bacterium]|nr:FtsX-like permease family protein [Fibrobacteria bacterium]